MASPILPGLTGVPTACLSTSGMGPQGYNSVAWACVHSFPKNPEGGAQPSHFAHGQPRHCVWGRAAPGICATLL